MKNNQKIIYWLPVLFWMIVIFVMSNRPAVVASGVDWQDFVIKKTAHFIEYFILTALSIYALKKTSSISLKKILILSIIISVLYALSDEFHQSFISGRTSTIRDVVIDSLGACFCGWVYSKKFKA